jgi:hypothetical protein
MQTQTTHTILNYVAAASLVYLTACGHDDASNPDTGKTTTNTASATAATSSSTQAGAGGGAAGADDDAIGASPTAPQGTCPDGFGCTRVTYPPGSRLCLKRGDVFAPTCDAAGKCPDLPDASCIDPGIGTLVCSQSCEVPSS